MLGEITSIVCQKLPVEFTQKITHICKIWIWLVQYRFINWVRLLGFGKLGEPVAVEPVFGCILNRPVVNKSVDSSINTSAIPQNFNDLDIKIIIFGIWKIFAKIFCF